jgi:hypothetical protein
LKNSWSPEINKADKYLRKYGVNSPPLETKADKIKYAVIVPAITEYENIKNFLSSFLPQDETYFKDTLLLFVINNSVNSSAEVKENNRNTIGYLRNMIKEESRLNIGLLDASTKGNELPERDAGVGLARKMGMDAVLKMFPDSDKGLLICTDADCTFDKNYLTEIVSSYIKTNYDAAVINFRHPVEDDTVADAVICYEIFLRYYVLGLKYAQSPFAFHTVGSSMVCTSGAYMDIEGMNKRKAAEDFYFLEKLAKKYKITKINTTTVYPSSRKSWRVPFGTGQRVNRFLANTHPEYVLYHPGCFKVLRRWHQIFFNNDILSANKYLSAAKEINENLYNFLLSQGFEKDWENIRSNIKNTSSVMKQKIRWFDGFRTLKLVHHLRDTETGLSPMFDAVDELLSMLNTGIAIQRKSEIPEREVQLEYLNRLREIDN